MNNNEHKSRAIICQGKGGDSPAAGRRTEIKIAAGEYDPTLTVGGRENGERCLTRMWQTPCLYEVGAGQACGWVNAVL